MAKSYADVVKVRDFEIGRLSWIMGGEGNGILFHESFKSENFLQLQSEGGGTRGSRRVAGKRRSRRDSKGKKDLMCHCSFWDVETHARTGERSLGAKDNLQLKASKETETSVLQSHETEFYQKPEWAWKQILSRAFKDEPRANRLILALWNSEQRN